MQLPTELRICSSNRLGMRLAQPLGGQATLYGATYGLTRGHKRYELSNHLGNVLSVITDRKNGEGRFQPHVLSHTDYYPFGTPMDTGERTWAFVDGNTGEEEGYRFGFQNQGQDKELWEGAVTFKYRIEDPRLGRFFSVDPLVHKYPWNSNYAFSENRLLDRIELEGCESTVVFEVIGYNPDYPNQSSVIYTVYWSDLFPGQEHGPLGHGTLYKFIHFTTKKEVFPSKFTQTVMDQAKDFAEKYDFGIFWTTEGDGQYRPGSDYGKVLGTISFDLIELFVKQCKKITGKSPFYEKPDGEFQQQERSKDAADPSLLEPEKKPSPVRRDTSGDTIVDVITPITSNSYGVTKKPIKKKDIDSLHKDAKSKGQLVVPHKP